MTNQQHGVKISTPKLALNTDSQHEKNKKFSLREAIVPMIEHLKKNLEWVRRN